MSDASNCEPRIESLTNPLWIQYISWENYIATQWLFNLPDSPALSAGNLKGPIHTGRDARGETNLGRPTPCCNKFCTHYALSNVPCNIMRTNWTGPISLRRASRVASSMDEVFVSDKSSKNLKREPLGIHFSLTKQNLDESCEHQDPHRSPWRIPWMGQSGQIPVCVSLSLFMFTGRQPFVQYNYSGWSRSILDSILELDDARGWRTSGLFSFLETRQPSGLKDSLAAETQISVARGLCDRQMEYVQCAQSLKPQSGSQSMKSVGAEPTAFSQFAHPSKNMKKNCCAQISVYTRSQCLMPKKYPSIFGVVLCCAQDLNSLSVVPTPNFQPCNTIFLLGWKPQELSNSWHWGGWRGSLGFSSGLLQGQLWNSAECRQTRRGFLCPSLANRPADVSFMFHICLQQIKLHRTQCQNSTQQRHHLACKCHAFVPGEENWNLPEMTANLSTGVNWPTGGRHANCQLLWSGTYCVRIQGQCGSRVQDQDQDVQDVESAR